MINLKAKVIGIMFIFLIKNAMADVSVCSVENQTPQGGTIKAVRGGGCNGYSIASTDCKSRGLGDAVRVSLLGIPTWHYEYECEGQKAINEKQFANQKEVITPYDESGRGGYVVENSSSSTSRYTPNSLQLLKQQCAELGFKPKTEKFGECVLELKKRDRANNTTNTAQQQVVDVKKGDGSPDDSQCISYGYKVGTESYAICRQKLDQNRKIQAEQERRYQEQLQIQQKQEAQRRQAELEQQQKATNQRKLDGLGLIFRAMQGGDATSVSPSTPTIPHFLRSQYYSNGNHMCNYDDGTVINVGSGICPNQR